jgi:predicted nucleotidyltransferase
MKALIEKNLKEIEKVCKERSVTKLYTFGSVNTDKFQESSDIDLLVEFGEIEIEEYADNYFDMCDDLEGIFERKVDLVTTKSVRNPYFKKELDYTRQLIFAA